MDLTTAVGKLILDQGVAITLLLFGGWFIVARIWPFYTKVYYPAVIERERQRDKDAATLANAMLELRAVVSQLVPVIAQVNSNTTEAFSEYRANMNASAHKADTLAETVGEIRRDVKVIKAQINRDYPPRKAQSAPQGQPHPHHSNPQQRSQAHDTKRPLNPR